MCLFNLIEVENNLGQNRQAYFFRNPFVAAFSFVLGADTGTAATLTLTFVTTTVFVDVIWGLPLSRRFSLTPGPFLDSNFLI